MALATEVWDKNSSALDNTDSNQHVVNALAELQQARQELSRLLDELNREKQEKEYYK